MNKDTERLQRALFECNVEKDQLRIDFERNIKNNNLSREKAFELIKSALSIAKRKGEETNWEAFEKQCLNILANV